MIGWKAGVSDQAYASRSEMLRDVVRIVRDEIQNLIADGVDYIQLDAPYYGVFIDEQHRATLRHAGIDPDQALRECVAADQAAIADLPRADVTLALHVCRGNSRSRWFSEGSYDPIAEQLFGTLDVDAFLLEYDAPEREGGFEPLRYLPSGKVAVLGLVTTKEADLEPVALLERRIKAAERVVPLDQLAVSPQCGFASVALGNALGRRTSGGSWSASSRPRGGCGASLARCLSFDLAGASRPGQRTRRRCRRSTHRSTST